jgi:16S rRNA (cytosine1402-N4)-methyltransferase
MTDGEADHNDKFRALPYATAYHAPVLCHTVVERLITDRTGTYVDGTLGGGGHTAALLDALDSGGRVIGIDQDTDALKAATDRLADAVRAGRFIALRGNFADMDALLRSADIGTVDGLLLDLGVSSFQIDTAARGFSYMAEGTLDMRMDPDANLTASEVVNVWTESELRRLLFELGEEPRSKRIARAIASARPVETTAELAGIIRAQVPAKDEVKTLSRVFQALRIAVNAELDVLERALAEATRLVRPGGRMVVISYHSLEDRRVKRYFRYGNFEGTPVRDFYGNLMAPWKELTSRPVSADDDEVAANPRARSARLRAAERTEFTDTDLTKP